MWYFQNKHDKETITLFANMKTKTLRSINIISSLNKILNKYWIVISQTLILSFGFAVICMINNKTNMRLILLNNIMVIFCIILLLFCNALVINLVKMFK